MLHGEDEDMKPMFDHIEKRLQESMHHFDYMEWDDKLQRKSILTDFFYIEKRLMNNGFHVDFYAPDPNDEYYKLYDFRLEWNTVRDGFECINIFNVFLKEYDIGGTYDYMCWDNIPDRKMYAFYNLEEFDEVVKVVEKEIGDRVHYNTYGKQGESYGSDEG